MNTNFKLVTPILISTLICLPVQAANIDNGGFYSNDFLFWNIDSDGFGDPSPSTDFAIINGAARIEADYSTDYVFVLNSLYQGTNLYTNPNETLHLSFDWTFAGEAATSDEVFKVALGKLNGDGSIDYYNASGALGYFLDQSVYGSGTFSADLASSFANQADWILEFQVWRGFDGLGSYALIDNVNLQAIAPVPLPGAVWLFAGALAAWLGGYRQSIR